MHTTHFFALVRRGLLASERPRTNPPDRKKKERKNSSSILLRSAAPVFGAEVGKKIKMKSIDRAVGAGRPDRRNLSFFQRIFSGVAAAG